jgi:hypothetical protein
MKHMYTNGLADEIRQLPEPFKSAIKRSRQWKLERVQKSNTTACWGTFFPISHTQDVSFTIWCSHEDGYYLNDVFGLQHVFSQRDG